ncbi:Trinucleotide repeat-containing 6C protein [Armadillidium nasatum]|uniref:Trinucleotide repeat-containing 6C protein n=1 Tax=Armadillidium nasatum TaxID=96803 RepID=A0A5N5SLQ9_9CRUS|nr:Trinucleotide repeat-containing 6C protein [Armadillidium nasatum]
MGLGQGAMFRKATQSSNHSLSTGLWAWSLSNRPAESGWPDSNTGIDGSSPPSVGVEKGSLGVLDSPWGSSSQTGAGSYGLDIKPFEPGKQWMVKNIEDDPNITPGSVTRSPLSLGIKDSDLLTSITKTSTSNTMSEMGSGGPLTSLSLSSNTWSFNPGAGQVNSSGSPLSSETKLGVSNSKTSSWSEGSQGSSALTSELWGAPGNKARGPPPGMSVNYGSREEAVKAQGNLNNCLLSNTTILAEFATDSEVKQLLGQGAPPTPGAPTTSWGSSGRGSTPTSQSTSNSKVDSWGSGNGSSLWGNGPAGSASLWGGGNLGEGDQHRATPSSLKSYLPDGLLTSSESM